MCIQQSSIVVQFVLIRERNFNASCTDWEDKIYSISWADTTESQFEVQFELDWGWGRGGGWKIWRGDQGETTYLT